ARAFRSGSTGPGPIATRARSIRAWSERSWSTSPRAAPPDAARSAFVKHGIEASAVPAARTVVYSRRSVHHQPVRSAVLADARGAASGTSGTGAARGWVVALR